jgi:hypothetical protein
LPKESIDTTFFTFSALARHLEGFQFVDAGGEVEVALGPPACGDRDLSPDRVEADVRDLELMRARGNAGEDVASRVVGEAGDAKRLDRHPRAFEQIAGGGVADGTGDHAGLGRGQRSGEYRGQEHRKERHWAERTRGCA